MVKLSPAFSKRLAALEASSDLTPVWGGDKRAACRAYEKMLEEIEARLGRQDLNDIQPNARISTDVDASNPAELYSELIGFG